MAYCCARSIEHLVRNASGCPRKPASECANWRYGAGTGRDTSVAVIMTTLWAASLLKCVRGGDALVTSWELYSVNGH